MIYNNKSYKITKIEKINNKTIKLIFYIPKIITFYKNGVKINKPEFNPPINYNFCFIKNLLVYYPKYYYHLFLNLYVNLLNNMFDNIKIEDYNVKVNKYNNSKKYNNLMKVNNIEENDINEIEKNKFNKNNNYNTSFNYYKNSKSPNNIKSPNIHLNEKFDINTKSFTPDIYKQKKDLKKSHSLKIQKKYNYNINSKSFKPINNFKDNDKDNIKENEIVYNINTKPFKPINKDDIKENVYNINSKSFKPKEKEIIYDINTKSFKPNYKNDIYNIYCKSFTPDIYKQKKKNISHHNPIIKKYKYNKKLNLFIPINQKSPILSKSISPKDNLYKNFNINSKSFTPDIYKQKKKNNSFVFKSNSPFYSSLFKF